MFMPRSQRQQIFVKTSTAFYENSLVNNQRIKTGIPRPVEAAVSLIGLIIVAPVLAVAAIAIVAASPGPVIFRQPRVGQHGHRFVLYKLRTMHEKNTGLQVTAGDDARVTAVGKFLRKTKLDELPELWNVFRGDMSLVGPRPEVPRYVDLENHVWRRVLEARPGITDPMTLRLRNEEALLATVEGNREQFYMETLQPFKLRGYVEYLDQRSWQSDIRVLTKTIIATLFPSKVPPPTEQEIVGSVPRSTKCR